MTPEEMEAEVNRVLQSMADNDMTPPIDINKGPLATYCRECKTLTLLSEEFDIEENYSELTCGGEECKGRHMAVAAVETLKERYRIK